VKPGPNGGVPSLQIEGLDIRGDYGWLLARFSVPVPEQVCVGRRESDESWNVDSVGSQKCKDRATWPACACALDAARKVSEERDPTRGACVHESAERGALSIRPRVWLTHKGLRRIGRWATCIEMS
jgi:hypothetical protein